ncbi:MAG: DNA gyrase inhibitor YacG [Nitrospira sp.]|nr:DNA gyrase inhibitor YacG [Nitrospira sp.]
MTCPLCRQPSTWQGNPWRPFCSERCQVTDLGAWATDRYRIPGLTLTAEDASLSDSLEGDDDTEKQQDR